MDQNTIVCGMAVRSQDSRANSPGRSYVPMPSGDKVKSPMDRRKRPMRKLN
ncbi:MAG TPA: hypothetical protein VMW85_02335 [Methanomassiliicoccales archaeon]|nr:hypothetical protein [Methanomassiliicoccales archaeon]